MEKIKRGSRGEVVRSWQRFLQTLKLYSGEVDGVFGLQTEEATKTFQMARKLGVDGIVGPKTWAEARYLSGTGYPLGGSWDRPDALELRPLTGEEEVRCFGEIKWRPRPIAGNSEAIVITNGWAKNNLTQVTIPQLAKCALANPLGEFPRTGRVITHKLMAEPFLELFQAWEDAGLLGHLLSYAGLYASRLVRGSTHRLSNHAYGTAIDLNAPWNWLGKVPAQAGEKGSVRELVPIARELGWWWGGWGWPPAYSRLDGMHFAAGSKLAERRGFCVTL